MMFDRAAYVRQWRIDNPKKYLKQRKAEYAARRARRRALSSTGCTCKASVRNGEPHLDFCAKFVTT